MTIEAQPQVIPAPETAEFAHFTVPSGPQGATADTRHAAVVSLPISGAEARQFLRDYMSKHLASGFRQGGLEGTLKQYAVVSVVEVEGSDEPHGGIFIDGGESDDGRYLRELHDTAGYLQESLRAEAAQRLAATVLGSGGMEDLADLARAILSDEVTEEEAAERVDEIMEGAKADPTQN
ncbi:hypothetical protein SEA_GUYFAGIERI_16 [Rhodococcus phage GuyFagieri]|nr:hypothetical protein SEA_GUYFAGIERI_16 [Rhodococcus phage GuyFagieri]